MLTSYAPSMFNLMKDYKVDKEDVCNRLSLCHPSMKARIGMPVSEPQKMYGTKKCLYGPSYWCSSLDAAKNCNVSIDALIFVFKDDPS